MVNTKFNGGEEREEKREKKVTIVENNKPVVSRGKDHYGTLNIVAKFDILPSDGS